MFAIGQQTHIKQDFLMTIFFQSKRIYIEELYTMNLVEVHSDLIELFIWILKYSRKIKELPS